MKVLGADLSITNSGFALMGDGVWPQLSAFAPKAAGIERAIATAHHVMQLVHEHRVDLVALEGYSMKSKYFAHQMGEVGGITRFLLIDAGIPYEDWPPATWRKALTGKGSIDKEHVVVAIYKKLRVEHESTDALEALGVAYVAWLHRQDPGTWTEYQRDAFKARKKAA